MGQGCLSLGIMTGIVVSMKRGSKRASGYTITQVGANTKANTKRESSMGWGSLPLKTVTGMKAIIKLVSLMVREFITTETAASTKGHTKLVLSTALAKELISLEL